MTKEVGDIVKYWGQRPQNHKNILYSVQVTNGIPNYAGLLNVSFDRNL